MRRWLLLIFLATIAIDWPQLPFNARATDVVFTAAAIAILTHATRSRPVLTRLDYAIAGYIGGSVVSMVASPDPRAGAIELVRQLYLVAIYVVIVLATRQGFAPTVGTGLALSGGVLAAIGLAAIVVQALFGVGTTAIGVVMPLPYIGDTLRLNALSVTPSMFACVLAVTVPFVVLHPAVTASRVRSWIAGLVLAAATVLTFSHAVAGVAVATVAAAWQRLRTQPARRALAIAAAAVIVIGFNFAAAISIRSVGAASFRDETVYQYAVDGGRARIAGVDVDYETMSYFRLKEIAWDAFTDRPLTGIGLDRFHAITEIAFQQGRLTNPYRVIDPHSTVIGRLAETGLIGGATLIFLWLMIANECRQLLAHDRSWMAVASVAALLGTLVISVNADVMNFRFVWVALGLVRGLRDSRP